MTLHLLELHNYPILEQLKLEEALLRADTRNFCIINQGSPRSIVMGISSKPNELIVQEKVGAANIPVIRRFSGGGCVIVDQNTLFVTFIFSKEHLCIEPFPEPILAWTEAFYQSALHLPQFQVRENDYILGNLKCGGNAQYIKKNRWLHHTSFLWDYDPQNMDLLHLPKKRPTYRQDRTHTDFLCPLKDHLPSQDHFTKGIKDELAKCFDLQSLTLSDAILATKLPYRKSTEILSK